MHGLTRERALGTLRARIAAIEKRPPLAGDVLLRRKAGAGFLVSPPGVMHEIHAEAARSGAAALGFALGQARALLRPERPAVYFMQLAHAGDELGRPHGAGLAAFGFDPNRLVFVTVRTVAELLWAMEEALACRAVAAVIADLCGEPKAFDFTASRRLAMRAASGGASLFVLRYGAERVASAAQLRWCVAPAPSGEMRFDPQAPGEARWQVVLERSRLGHAGSPNESSWLVSWNNDFEPAGNRKQPPAGRTAGAAAALPGAHPAVLGRRLQQTA
jgi:protein ImuA